MKVVFFGSSLFSLSFLEGLKENIVLVITTPDMPQKRGKRILPNPVKAKAMEMGLPFIAVQNFNEEIKEKIASVSPDAFIVVSFGKIIPSSILSIVKYPLNLHPSPLPLYRGAAPIERQIMDGITKSAVSIMLMNEKLDRGDIVLQSPFDISFTDTKEDVEKKIVDIGIPLFKKALQMIEEKNLNVTPQQGKGSYAKKITKGDELIRWNEKNVKIYNKIRALYPLPATCTIFRGKRLKIFKAEIANLNKGHPGEIIDLTKEGFVVQCGSGSILVKEVQLEGKKRIKARDFMNGSHLKCGEKLGLNENI